MERRPALQRKSTPIRPILQRKSTPIRPMLQRKSTPIRPKLSSRKSSRNDSFTIFDSSSGVITEISPIISERDRRASHTSESVEATHRRSTYPYHRNSLVDDLFHGDGRVI